MHFESLLVVDVDEPFLRDGVERFVVEPGDGAGCFVQVQLGVEGGGGDVEGADVTEAAGNGEVSAKASGRKSADSLFGVPQLERSNSPAVAGVAQVVWAELIKLQTERLALGADRTRIDNLVLRDPPRPLQVRLRLECTSIVVLEQQVVVGRAQ